MLQYLQDEFSAVITKALMTLVHGLETKFDAEMVAMTRVSWATLESVGDQSEQDFMDPYMLLYVTSFTYVHSCALMLKGDTGCNLQSKSLM